jgi:cystathionine beta-lyase/cystathionine gamma-synthase
MGRAVDFFSPDIEGDWEARLRPGTKAIYLEPVSNPLLKIPDLPRLARFAKDQGLISIVDNTFPSPVNFNPIEMGFDVVLHSATKYLNGHSDIVAGCVLGKREIIQEVKELLNHLGGSLDPHACFLLQRGLKTLFLRVKHQNETALEFARALQGKVPRVIYPGLPSHPGHKRAGEFFRGYGAMVSFEFPGDAKATEAFLKGRKVAFFAPSLGGVETLVTRPAGSSHAGVAPADRLKQGIGDNLVRVSIGVEHPDDIIRDFLDGF